MKRTLIIRILTVLLFFISSVRSESQTAVKDNKIPAKNGNPAWQLFSPADGKFSIELPAKPSFSKNPDSSDDGVADKWFFELFKCTKDVSFYFVPLSSSSEETDKFFIEVFDVSACKRTTKLFSKEIDGLFLWFGGDNKNIISETRSKLQGRNTRGIVFRNGRIGEGNGGRIWAIDDRNRIYLLSYETESMNDDAEMNKKIDRIFRSFRLK